MIDQTTVRDEHERKNAVRKRLRNLRLALEIARSEDEAAANGHKSKSASMSLRKLHGFLGGDARKGYCREALYRSEEANKLIKSEGSNKLLARSLPDGKTPIHCEQVPSRMWWKRVVA